MPFIKRVYGMRLIKQNCCTKKESLNLCVASACTHEEDEIFALYGTYGDPKLLIQNFKCVIKVLQFISSLYRQPPKLCRGIETECAVKI